MKVAVRIRPLKNSEVKSEGNFGGKLSKSNLQSILHGNKINKTICVNNKKFTSFNFCSNRRQSYIRSNRSKEGILLPRKKAVSSGCYCCE